MTKSAGFYFAAILGSALCFIGKSAAQSSTPAVRDQIYSALSGEWTGQLEYRDFQSDERVVLPTWLEVKTTADGRSLEFAYNYDDGPTKTVTELSTVTIDTPKNKFIITSDRDHSSDIYQMEGVAAINAKGRAQFKLTGTGQENDKPVDVRITVTIDRNLYRFTKETRVLGAEFKFRDGYVLTRRNPGR